MTHLKYSSGFEIWYEYDEKGNRIHYKDSGGYEVWYEYNEKGNLVHYKDSSGNEKWYDENGNIIKQTQGTSNIKLVKQAVIPIPIRPSLDYPHSWQQKEKETPEEKKKKKFRYKKAYDPNYDFGTIADIIYLAKQLNGNIEKAIQIIGNRAFRAGHPPHRINMWKEKLNIENIRQIMNSLASNKLNLKKQSQEEDPFTEFYPPPVKYDEQGRKIYERDEKTGREEWYDEQGNLTHIKYSSGSEEWYEYDERGNIRHWKDSSGNEIWYDEKGNIIKQTQGTSNKPNLKKQSQEEDPFAEFYPPPVKYDEQGRKIYERGGSMMNEGI